VQQHNPTTIEGAVERGQRLVTAVKTDIGRGGTSRSSPPGLAAMPSPRVILRALPSAFSGHSRSGSRSHTSGTDQSCSGRAS
jgi:hypothetical protein